MLLSDRANAFTEKLAPGLITALTDVGLAELERDSATGIDIFRTRGRTGMFVPENLGGADATATAALHYMLTLGSLAPSLSIVATMHHFSVASLAKSQQDFDELESFMLTAIATDNLLVSSAFAEARPDGDGDRSARPARSRMRPRCPRGDREPGSRPRTTGSLVGEARSCTRTHLAFLDGEPSPAVPARSGRHPRAQDS